MSHQGYNKFPQETVKAHIHSFGSSTVALFLDSFSMSNAFMVDESTFVWIIYVLRLYSKNRNYQQQRYANNHRQSECIKNWTKKMAENIKVGKMVEMLAQNKLCKADYTDKYFGMHLHLLAGCFWIAALSMGTWCVPIVFYLSLRWQFQNECSAERVCKVNGEVFFEK